MRVGMIILAFIRTKILLSLSRYRLPIVVYQRWRELAFLPRVIKGSIYYREKKQNSPNLDIWSSKSAWMQAFDSINTANIKLDQAFSFAKENEENQTYHRKLLDQYTVGLSSGTTGAQSLFVTNDREIANYTGTILAKLFSLKELLTIRSISFFMRADSPLYQKSGVFFTSFKFVNITKPFFNEILEFIERPTDVLIAQPQVLRQIVDESKRRQKTFSLKKVVSIAEVLEPDERREFELFFKIPIMQIYQATEGFLGATCPFGTIHMNEDLFIIQRKPLQKGYFLPILTDLHRKTQPVIRHLLNDVLIETTTPCPCGSKYIGLVEIVGRKDDCFTFKTNHVTLYNSDVIEIMPDAFRQAILRALPLANFTPDLILHDYIFTQHLDESLHLEIFYESNQQSNYESNITNTPAMKMIEDSLRRELSQLESRYPSISLKLSIGWKVYRNAERVIVKRRRIQRLKSNFGDYAPSA